MDGDGLGKQQRQLERELVLVLVDFIEARDKRRQVIAGQIGWAYTKFGESFGELFRIDCSSRRRRFAGEFRERIGNAGAANGLGRMSGVPVEHQ